MSTKTMTARRVWAACFHASAITWAGMPKSPQYVESAARLLYMTAAHESGGFRYRRQIGFKPAPQSLGGAFSLWQFEIGSVRTSFDWLRAHPDAADRIDSWLGMSADEAIPKVSTMTPQQVLVLSQDQKGDRLAAVFARMHYYWITSKPIPSRKEDQAYYAKRYWNTLLGKATPGDYLEALNDYWLDEFHVGGWAQ